MICQKMAATSALAIAPLIIPAFTTASLVFGKEAARRRLPSAICAV
jgi:hypothetical protein